MNGCQRHDDRPRPIGVSFDQCPTQSQRNKTNPDNTDNNNTEEQYKRPEHLETKTKSICLLITVQKILWLSMPISVHVPGEGSQEDNGALANVVVALLAEARGRALALQVALKQRQHRLQGEGARELSKPSTRPIGF
eukprot:scaffold41563_cov30-Prasinocladus_malaysianus.AAC.1